MLALACRLAEGLGTSTLHAELIPTAKNAPCARFSTASAMTPVDEHHFRIDVQSGTAVARGDQAARHRERRTVRLLRFRPGPPRHPVVAR